MGGRYHSAEQCEAIREDAGEIPSNGYKNMEAMLRGYNIFKGSPFAKSDHGYSSRLFALDWTKPVKDGHGHTRPRDTNVLNTPKCSSATSSKVSLDEADI
jgi:hypothetical protein